MDPILRLLAKVQFRHRVPEIRVTDRRNRTGRSGEQDAETWCDEIAEEQSAQKQSAALDRTRGRFFIRDCYRELYHRVVDVRQQYHDFRVSTTAILVTGQPGTGE